MAAQKNQSQTQLLDLLTEIVKQNNQVMQQNSQLINLLQIQTQQNSELLLLLEQEQDEPSCHEYLDS
ncbi:hypothetical protein [Acinetobacter sp.]|uniref:hypothetical protein n=1 Tax=Acinetobacter sp. TaxID=472 RepID=UPI0035B2B319